MSIRPFDSYPSVDAYMQDVMTFMLGNDEPLPLVMLPLMLTPTMTALYTVARIGKLSLPLTGMIVQTATTMSRPLIDIDPRFETVVAKIKIGKTPDHNTDLDAMYNVMAYKGLVTVDAVYRDLWITLICIQYLKINQELLTPNATGLLDTALSVATFVQDRLEIDYPNLEHAIYLGWLGGKIK